MRSTSVDEESWFCQKRGACWFEKAKNERASERWRGSGFVRGRVVIGRECCFVRFDWWLVIFCSDCAVKKLFALYAEAFVGLVCGDEKI